MIIRCLEVARLEHKQRAANYAAAQLTPEAVSSRRAMSNRLHSSHCRSLLFDVKSPSEEPLDLGAVVEVVGEDDSSSSSDDDDANSGEEEEAGGGDDGAAAAELRERGWGNAWSRIMQVIP